MDNANDIKTKTLELAKEASKDINDVIKDLSESGFHVPFLSTVYSLVSFAIAKSQKYRFEEFLNEIRLPLAFDSVETVGAHIAQNIHHRWMSDGLSQGWRLGLETMDDTARKCAYLMVADYMAQKRTPDRAYQQLARLFIASDEEILRMLLRLAEVLLRFKESCIIATTMYEVDDGWDVDYAVFPLVGKFVTLDFVQDEYSVEPACEVAVLANLGVQWSDPTIKDERPGHEIVHRICQVDPHHLTLWKKLYGYLEPILKAAPT